MPAKPSLKKNALANYVGQAYSTFIGIVIFPFYLKYLGAEAYGLVGFYMVLQVWLGMMDIGMTPMLNREVAAARAQEHRFLTFRKLLRSVELVFAAFALVTSLGVFLGRNWIATHWLKVETLDLQVVGQCITLMGFMIGLRFFSTVYRSGLSGMEAQIRLNMANVTISTLKAFGALAVLHWISAEPLAYFGWQLLVALLEPVLLGSLFYRTLPATSERLGLSFSWNILKPTLPLGLSIAYTSAIWTVITQLDKLLLSNILPLREYGFFALVAMLSNGVMQVAAPISNALLPRMTYLHSSNQEMKMLDLYRKASQVIAVIMLSITGTVAMFGKQLLFAWSGSMEAAIWAEPIIFWYMLGNALLSVLAFQYYLQYAHGKLRLHVQMNTVLVAIAAPLIAFSAYRYGAYGTAVSWFVLQFVCFLVWPPIVHHKFAPGLHMKWLMRDILPVALGAAVGVGILSVLPVHQLLTLQRYQIFFILMAMGGIVLTFSCLGSSALRSYAMQKIGGLKTGRLL